MTHYYEPEFKQKMVRLHLEEGRTLLSLQNEYKVSKAAISHWVKDFRTVNISLKKTTETRSVGTASRLKMVQ
jgi:transposase